MMQAGMLFHMAMEPESAVYHNLNTFNIAAELQPALFQDTLARCAARHEMLRTSFDLPTFSEPLQLVHRHHLAAREQEAAWNAWVANEKASKFGFRTARLTAVFFRRRRVADQAGSARLRLPIRHRDEGSRLDWCSDSGRGKFFP